MQSSIKISKLAVVETTDIGKNVLIDEFAIIRESVKIGDNVIIHSHVVINSGAVISDDVEVFPGAVIGKEVKRAESSPQTSDKEKPVFIGQNSSIGP